MREVAPVAVVALGILWIMAVCFGILARAFKLTRRRDWVGSVARVCGAIDLLSL